MKNLLLIAIVFLIVWMLRKSWAGASRARSRSAQREPERMVKCAHCGVNQPVSESILTHGRYYCCEAHRLESEAADD